jgi:hypothetical protein
VALSVGEVEATLRLKDEFASKLQDIRGTLREFGGDMGSVSTQASNAWDALGTKFSSVIANLGENVGGKLKSAIEDPIGSIQGALTGTLEVMAPFAVGLTAVGTVAAAAGKALHDLAMDAAGLGSNLMRTHEITGMSIEAASAMSYAVQVAGGSLEQMTNAVFMLQKRMDDGGPAAQSVTDALNRLGLSAELFKAASPDTQVLMLSQGFRDLSPEVDKAGIAFDLFGRLGREQLPVLLKNMADLAEEGGRVGYGMGSQAAQGAEDLEMASQKLHLQLEQLKTDIGVDLIPMVTKFYNAASWGLGTFKDLADLTTHASASADLFNYALGNLDTALTDLPDPTKSASDNFKLFTAAVQARAAVPLRAALVAEAEITSLLNRTVKESIAINDAHEKSEEKLAAAAQKYTEWLRAAVDPVDQLRRGLAQLAKDAKPAVDMLNNQGVKGFQNQIHQLIPILPQFKDAVTDSAQKAASAFSIVGAIVDNISGKFAELTAIAARTGEAIASAVMKGDTIGTITALAAGAVSFISKLFGGGESEEAKKARLDYEAGLTEQKRRIDAIASAFQGLDVAPTIIDMATRAMQNAEGTGADFDAQLKAIQKTVAAIPGKFQAIQDAASKCYGVITPAIKDHIEQLLRTTLLTDGQRESLKNLLNEGNVDYKGLADLAKGYGINVDQLGPKFQQNLQNQDWGKLYSDWELLTTAIGPDGYAGALAGISPKIGEMVTASRNAGTSIPEYMRPTLEAMVRMGTLTDGAGGYLHDLNDIHFADTDPLHTALGDLNSTLDNLTAALTGQNGLIAALERLNNTPLADKHATISYDTQFNGFDRGDGDPSIPPTYNPDPSYYNPGGMQAGTPGLRFMDFGGGTNVVLHNREAVVPEDRLGDFMAPYLARVPAMSGGAGGVTIPITLQVDGATFARTTLKLQAEELRRLRYA